MPKKSILTCDNDELFKTPLVDTRGGEGETTAYE